MSMNSMTLRWRTLGVCTLTVLAMLALLGGCSKKAEQTETTTEEVPVAVSPMAGTYTADLMAADATQKVTLTLNADNTAVMSVAMSSDQPGMVKNGTWAMGAGPNAVDVSIPEQMGDSTITLTMNFAASGDTLTMTHTEVAGATLKDPAFGTLKLVKVHAMGEEAH